MACSLSSTSSTRIRVEADAKRELDVKVERTGLDYVSCPLAADVSACRSANV